MHDETALSYPKINRRHVLRKISGLTALGVSSVVTSSSVAADPGDQEWAFETDEPVLSSPTVVGGTVFVGSEDHNLYAVDAETGSEKWAFETGDSVYSSPTVFDPSPTVVDGTVFVGSDDSNLYAVDAETGSKEWGFETGDLVQSSPTVVDGTVFVGSYDNNLYAVDAEFTGSMGESESSGSEDDQSESNESTPGFGIGSGITAIGATGYM